MMDMYSSSLFNYDDLHELCRICGTASNDLNSLFDDNGSSYDFSSKVNEYLPITVSEHGHFWGLVYCGPIDCIIYGDKNAVKEA